MDRYAEKGEIPSAAPQPCLRKVGEPLIKAGKVRVALLVPTGTHLLERWNVVHFKRGGGREEASERVPLVSVTQDVWWPCSVCIDELGRW